MYRKLAALVLAAALLCSCSARVTVQRYPAELPRAESPAATPTPEPVPTFTEEQKAYGSAALLTDATVLVNVFLNDAAHGQTWDAESRAAAVQRTQLAVDWITEQAAGYEAAVNLICDRSADGSDSTLTRSYLVQSAIQGGENSEESSAFLDEMDTLCASLAALCTRAFAMCACDIFLDFEFFGCTCGDFFQCERHLDTKVCSAILRFLTLTATEAATKSSKSAVSSEYVAEHREDVVHGESASAESSAESSARSVKSELVVLLTFLWIV